MKKHIVALAAGIALSACGGGNPFVADDGTGGDPGTGTGGDTGTPIDSDRTVPPGTQDPTPNLSIFRSEPTSTVAGREGNGFATNIAYDPTTDEFSVDNLGFDGDNTYTRVNTPQIIQTIGHYAMYEAASQLPDTATGTPVNQLTHRAIYGVSRAPGEEGRTKFAIVRTGAYVEYGFGGFIYQREGGVTLPTTGQATYKGTSAGLRDYNGTGGLEYTTGDIQIDIDFDDFNDVTGTRGDAVKGKVTNRKIFDLAGNEITKTVLDRINADLSTSLTAIPTANFVIGPGVMDDNGEILGEINSFYADSNGQSQVFEEGNYYAVMAGDDADEIVGVFVLETSRDPVASNVRDTSGFIVYRD
ncbi:MAG: hypothetical protein GJ676_13675 [Rhodobacteraceae bacterium]|nr:hypothetical protein [Paracoccaceae bacterium]